MIIEYHRPETLESALALLARSTPETVPLGGGSAINRPSPAELAVVDLQALGLDSLQVRGNSLELGARLLVRPERDALERRHVRRQEMALGQAALPMGLMCVGAALQLGTLSRDLGPTLAASACSHRSALSSVRPHVPASIIGKRNNSSLRPSHCLV